MNILKFLSRHLSPIEELERTLIKAISEAESIADPGEFSIENIGVNIDTEKEKLSISYTIYENTLEIAFNISEVKPYSNNDEYGYYDISYNVHPMDYQIKHRNLEFEPKGEFDKRKSCLLNRLELLKKAPYKHALIRSQVKELRDIVLALFQDTQSFVFPKDVAPPSSDLKYRVD